MSSAVNMFLLVVTLGVVAVALIVDTAALWGFFLRRLR
jgi:hypothetical protein